MNIQPTSLQAYFGEILPDLGRRQKAVLEVFTMGSFTNAELANLLQWPINTITPRVKELRDLGLLVEDSIRKCSSTGRNAKAWKLKQESEQLRLV